MMTLDNYIALLTQIRAEHGGQTVVAVHHGGTGVWRDAPAPKIVPADRYMREDLGVPKVVKVG